MNAPEPNRTAGDRPGEHGAEVGHQVRERLFGPQRGDTASPPYRRALDELVNNVLFGEVWADGTLALQQRSLVTMAVLVTQGREAQLRTHIEAGLRIGISEEKIAAMITHVGFYAGIPAAYTGLAVAKSVFDEGAV